MKSLFDIAMKGRFGDTELAHVNPREKAMLKAMGGSGTINPNTGLREYFDRNDTEDQISAFSSILGRDSWLMNIIPGAKKWQDKVENIGSEFADKLKEQRFEDAMYGGDGVEGIKDRDFVTEGVTPELLEDLGLDPEDTKYFDDYDMEKEDRLKRQYDIRDADTTASAQTGLFGLLSTSNLASARQDFEGAGNYPLELQKQRMLSGANRQLEASRIGRESSIEGMRDAYNQDMINRIFQLNNPEIS